MEELTATNLFLKLGGELPYRNIHSNTICSQKESPAMTEEAIEDEENVQWREFNSVDFWHCFCFFLFFFPPLGWMSLCYKIKAEMEDFQCGHDLVAGLMWDSFGDRRRAQEEQCHMHTSVCVFYFELNFWCLHTSQCGPQFFWITLAIDGDTVSRLYRIWMDVSTKCMLHIAFTAFLGLRISHSICVNP